MTEAAEQTEDKRLRCDVGEIANLMDSAPIKVQGRTVELIRDAYDRPVEWLHNAHAAPDDGKAIYLLGRGASATLQKRQEIAESGIPAMAINHYPKDGPKPRYWCTGDPAGYFPNYIWDDPEVMKFSPIGSCGNLCPRDGAYDGTKRAMDCPNTHFFHSRYDDPLYENWLHTPWINWGTSMFGEDTPSQWFNEGAARSSMFIGLKLCWHLGYRTVLLLGCDATPGHHPAPMYWPTIIYLLDQLKPTFKRYCFNVFNCNPDSHIRSFPFVGPNGIIE